MQSPKKIIIPDSEFEGFTYAETQQNGWNKRLTEKYNCHRHTVSRRRDEYFNSRIGIVSKEMHIGENRIKHGWAKSKSDSVFYTNPFYDPDNINDITNAFEEILLKYEGKVFKKKPIIKQAFHKQLIVTTTDEHVGMDANPNGLGLFGYEYNIDVFKKGYDTVFDVICQKHDLHRSPFDVLVLENLGDEQDGWNGFTTRGGHSLPQNASNFDVAEAVMDAKIELIHKIVDNGIAKKIILRKVGNDNHSGDFGKVVNLGVKKAIEGCYRSGLVEVDILHKFIEQREWGIHSFLLTHGKDDKNMKFGLPFYLNDKSINFIKSYISHFELDKRFEKIHLDKGDLHQLGMEARADFTYNNFMSFAPPSSYTQHNYADGSPSGFTCRVFHKNDTQEDRTNHFFNYKKSINQEKGHNSVTK